MDNFFLIEELISSSLAYEKVFASYRLYRNAYLFL